MSTNIADLKATLQPDSILNSQERKLFEHLDRTHLRMLKVVFDHYPKYAESKDFDGKTGLSRSANLNRASHLSDRGLIVAKIKPGTENRNKPPYVYCIVPEYIDLIAEKVKNVEYAQPKATFGQDLFTEEVPSTKGGDALSEETKTTEDDGSLITDSATNEHSSLGDFANDHELFLWSSRLKRSRAESELKQARLALEEAQAQVKKLEKIVENHQELIDYYESKNS